MVPPPDTTSSPALKRRKTQQQTTLTGFFSPTRKQNQTEGSSSVKQNDKAGTTTTTTTTTTVAVDTDKGKKSTNTKVATSVSATITATAATASGVVNNSVAATTAVTSGSSTTVIITDASGESSSKSEAITNSKNLVDPIIPSVVPTSKHSIWKVYENGSCLCRTILPLESDNTINRDRVAGFDLGETLLVSRIAGFPNALEHYELWNNNVIDKLRDLYDNKKYKLIIFTNQGGIRNAANGKKATFIKNLIDWLAYIIDRPLYCIISTNKKSGFHKPSILLWKIAEQIYNNGKSFDITNSLYVGDSITYKNSQTDETVIGDDDTFVKNISSMSGKDLQFYTPEIYFGPCDKDNRTKVEGITKYETPPDYALAARKELLCGYLDGPIVLILCGVQGSGKSYFCEQVVTNDCSTHWLHLSQDTINNGKPGKREKVEQETKLALQRGLSVIIDRMHLDELQRSYFIDCANEMNVPAHTLVLYPSKDIIAKRVRERQNHVGNVQGDTGARMALANYDKLIIPTFKEGFELISIARSDEYARKMALLYRNVISKNHPASNNDTDTTLPRNFTLHNDVVMPTIALGTQKLGRKVAENIVSIAIKVGFEAIDTAPTYNNEDKLGLGINNNNNLFCIIKVPKKVSSREAVREELSNSLSKLHRQHVDLLLLHWPEAIATGTLKDIWEEMELCKQDGLTKAIGVCNFNIAALQILLSQCTIPPAVNQIERHPLLPQWDLVDFCSQHDILIQAHTPLCQGSTELLEHPILQRIASEGNKTPAQVALLWNMQQGVAVIPKSVTEKHLKEISSLANTSSLLTSTNLKDLNSITERKRFVSPPFMFGSHPFCWDKQIPR